MINVPALARKSPRDVERVLGPPDGSTGVQATAHDTRTYRRGSVQVVYVDGQAAWIKLYYTSGLKFSRDTLPKLGLPVKQPTYVNPGHVMSWDNILFLKEVSIYADQEGGVSSVLVCVNTGAENGRLGAKPVRRAQSPGAALAS